MMLLSYTMATPKIGKLFFIHTGLVLCSLATLTIQPVAALEHKIENHNFELGTRARLTNVNANNDAKAASLLVRLRATSEWSQQFSTLFELDSVVFK
jgi:hypothetical protein